MLPIAGALIGGALGGPVGLVAGIKLGGLAAVGGGIVGMYIMEAQTNLLQVQIIFFLTDHLPS